MPECTHLDQVQVTQLPESVEGCEECLKTGEQWLHLRICLECGKVGCCDDSPEQARQPPRPLGATTADPLARARRRLVVVLHRRDRDGDPRGAGRDAYPAVADAELMAMTELRCGCSRARSSRRSPSTARSGRAEVGEKLFEPGDRTYPFVAILEGEITILDSAATRSSATPEHGFLGEMNLLSGQTVFLTAEVTKPLRYLAVDREVLRKLLFEDPALSELLLPAFVERREYSAGARRGRGPDRRPAPIRRRRGSWSRSRASSGCRSTGHRGRGARRARARGDPAGADPRPRRAAARRAPASSRGRSGSGSS